MARETSCFKIGDLFELVNGYAFKSGEFIKSGIPVIKIKNVKAGRMLYETLSYVDPRFLQSRPDKVIKKGELLITMSGNRLDGSPETWVGKVAQFDKDSPYLLNQRVGILRPRKGTDLDRRFFSYSLSSEFYQKEFISIATSSGGQANLSPPQILSAPIEVPSLSNQKRIAHILGTLDDKIELNARMNATLEAMARALFQSWFVDFEPVERNAEGRTRHSEDSLFPGSLEDSAIGKVPTGWEVCPLSEKIQLLSGGTPKTSESTYWDGDVPWYSVRDAPTETDVWVVQTDKSVTELGIANSAAKIFPEKTTIISARGTVGKVALTGVPMAMNQSCYGIRGISGYGNFFTYYLVREATVRLQQNAHGSVFDTITTRTFESLDCVFPNKELTIKFDKAVEPLLTKIRANLHQSRTLATLRDTLLPKLLAGEL